MKHRAAFLDRDGTINVDVGYTHRLADLALVERAAEGLRQLAALGFRLFIVTNQSGIARGMFDEHQMQAFNGALCRLLAEGGVEIAGVYYCPFHPAAVRAEYRHDSPLRKPRPGMLLQAASEHDLDLSASLAIGDKQSDVLAGQAAGCAGVLVRTGDAGRGEPHLSARPDFVAADLVDAAQFARKLASTGVGPAFDCPYSSAPGHSAMR
jgi:D-glycero-D-manno-heptose 1,7-bisphosphate phosphatase